MFRSFERVGGRALRWCSVIGPVLGLVAACGGGGGGGNAQDSGASKTTLRVDASDADGDSLTYEWRVTGGVIDNRNARETTWTMPDGPGLHFAYVLVSDGKGGHATAQYAVSSDNVGTVVQPRAAIARAAPVISTTAISAGRLRFQAEAAPAVDGLAFAAGGGGARRVSLPDVAVELTAAGGTVAVSGTTNLAGEIALPDLEPGTYTLRCATVPGTPLAGCGGNVTVSALTPSTVVVVTPPADMRRNLRVYGHIDLADGAVCGFTDEFFARQSAATVQLLQADGSALTPVVRVNMFGDYAIDSAVSAASGLRVKVTCEALSETLDLPPAGAAGYSRTAPVEVSRRFANQRPTVVKVVANGPDGNVRGQMVEFEEAPSVALTGSNRFLSYKGQDTRASACAYYVSIGAAGGCDAEGNLQDGISLDDWKRSHKFKPWTDSNTEVSATYVNRMDLNLTRRMLATQTAADRLAFVVCNHPGPVGATQREIDAAIDDGLGGRNQVACVAMEWSTSPGVNDGKPFTKFLTFGPDGALLPSINLDGRGEKYMPGACVACHGGTRYSGHFDARALSSPMIGSAFLPFDTSNYLFASKAGYGEAEQGASLKELNRLVTLTDQYSSAHTLQRLYQGWYADGGTALNKAYVPDAWLQAEAGSGGGFTTPQPGVAKLYREVVGGTCRTCHAGMGVNNARFDWDSNVAGLLRSSTTRNHFCGGSSDLMLNASMPNALASRNRLTDRINADSVLADLLTQYFGCVSPLPDPAYARR